MRAMPTESEPAVVIEGDCLDVLSRDFGPAFVLTDPPYGIALESHGTLFRGIRPIAGDETQQVGQLALDTCRGFDWPVLAFADPALPWAGKWRQQLVWDKGGAVGIGGDRKTCWKFTWELVQVGQFPEVFGNREPAVLSFPILPSNYADHPAAKPVALMRYLLRKLVPLGGLVVDPFAGSGTTAIAAMREGRRCILIEKDARYAAHCRDRIAKAMGAGSLLEGMA